MKVSCGRRGGNCQCTCVQECIHYGNSLPAIPLAVKYDYVGCVNIDDVSDPEDPVIVWMYDSWNRTNC